MSACPNFEVLADKDRREAHNPDGKGVIMNGYAHPEVLVETDWVKGNLGQPGIKLVEIDVDTTAYDAGHIPGAIGFNWRAELQDQVGRDIIGKEAFEQLVGGAGISPQDTVILYGDNNNWFAANGFWLFKIYGHKDVRLMNGGRTKWLKEPDRELTTERPNPKPVPYKVSETHPELRALLPDVMQVVKCRACNLVDVRSHDEFTGKVIAPPGMDETAQRGGHIPGATCIPWGTPVAPDGTFKSADELRTIYLEQKGVDPNRPTIAYCRIGERAAHTWFVLRYLLGLGNVRNYDGSWTEYGNLIGAPIEK
jgi:thiosulfate/3-mercaptopyruvate sulfurtransferase